TGEQLGSDPASGMVFAQTGLVAGLSLGPVVGATSDATARIWARGQHGNVLRVQYRRTGDATWLTSGQVTFDGSKDFTAVVPLGGLAPATSYEYRPVVDCSVDTLSPGAFRTQASPGAATHVRFAYGADFHYSNIPFNIFPQIAAKNPDF